MPDGAVACGIEQGRHGVVHDPDRGAFDIPVLAMRPERGEPFAAQVPSKEIADAGAGEPENDVSVLARLKDKETLQ